MQIDDLPLTERNDLATTQADQSVSTVAATLKANNIGAMPVCDQSGAVIGIISERDIVQGFAERGAGLGDLKVSDLMTSNVITCHLGDDVNNIMEIMNENKIRHIPVLDGDELYSIVSSRDVMTVVLNETKANFHTIGLAYETVR